MLEIILLAAAVSVPDVVASQAVDTKPLTTLSETAAEQLGLENVAPAPVPRTTVAEHHAEPAENPDLMAATGVRSDGDIAPSQAMGMQFARSNEQYMSLD